MDYGNCPFGKKARHYASQCGNHDTLLHEEGRRAAQAFLEAHAMDLGRRSTLNIDDLLQQF